MQSSKLSLFIILLIGFTDYLGIGLVYPIFAVLIFDANALLLPLDSSNEYRGTILGILIALTPLTQFFCSPLLGTFSDIKGRRTALILGICVGSIGYALAITGIYLKSLILLFLYRIFVGASDATASVAQAALVDISTEENKTTRFAYLNFCIGFGFTLGPFLGGMIADSSIIYWFDYSTPIIATTLISFLNLILVYWHFPNTQKTIENSRFDFFGGLCNIKKIFLLKNLKWLFFADFALSFGWAFFNEFIPILLCDRFGFTLSRIGTYYALTGAWYAIGTLIAARFAHRFSPEKAAAMSLLLAAFCMLMFIAIEHSYYIWCLLPFMMCCLAFVYPTALTIVANKTDSQNQGEVLGVYQSVGAAAMGLSPLFVGSAIGIYPALTAFGGAFCMLLACIGFWMSKQTIPEPPLKVIKPNLSPKHS